MVTKPRTSATAAAPQSAAKSAPDAAAAKPARDIWLAGLGALASAQAEGSRAFEALVRQGLEMQNMTQALAKERMAEAAEQMQAMTRQASAGVAPWNRLGSIFEDRVAQALVSMGMPTARELAALAARVQALERAQQGQPPAAARKTTARRKAS